MKKILHLFIASFFALSLSAQWKSIRPQQAFQNLYALSFASDSVGWIGGDGQSLYLTQDFGSSLQPINLPVNNGKVSAIHAMSASQAYVLLSKADFAYGNNNTGYRKYLLKTNNGGQNWQQQLINQNDAQDLLCMSVRGNDTIYVAGSEGMIYRSYNAGNTWDSLNINLPTRSIHAIHARPNGEVVVGGDSGFVYRSTNFGNNWTMVHQLSLGLQNGQPILNFFALSQDTIYACGRGQSILRSDDGGANWQEINNQNLTTEFTAVHFKDTLNGVATGAIFGSIATNGGFYTTTDGGRNWSRRSMSWIPGENKYLFDLHVVGNEILAVGELGRILKSNDYGVSRTVPNEVPNLPLTTDIEVLSDQDYVMSCRQGGNTFAHSNDSGKTWTTQRNSFSKTPFFVANNNNGLLVSFENEKLLRSYDNGQTWSETTTTASRVNYGTFINPSTFIGTDESAGNFIYSTDTLNTISTKAFPSSRSVEKLEVVDANVWFAIDNRKDLFRTLDGGNNWQLMNTNATADFVFEDSLNGWGISLGSGAFQNGIVKTIDGGVTWNLHNTQTDFDKHKFQKIAKAGDVIIASCTNFYRSGVLVSTNGGASWVVYHDLLPYEPTDIEINQFGTWIYSDLVDFVIENRAIKSSTSSVGITEATAAQFSFDFYPNPMDKQLTIEAESKAIGERFSLFTLAGKLVYESAIKAEKTTSNLNLPTGIYFLRIGSRTEKLIVQ